MRISTLLQGKGTTVATVPPDATVTDVLARLAEHRVGALVVSTDGEHIDGIVSERDVVRCIHEHGPTVLDDEVRRIMTVEVHTCEPGDAVEDLMGLMTEQRIRHVPVVEGGRLA